MSNPFASASEAATAHLSGNAPLATSVADSPTPTPVETPAPLVTPPDPVETVELKGQTYKVKVQNEEIDVPIEELLKGYSRTSDYTKKAMALADQRKQFDTDRQQFESIQKQAQEREAQLVAFLKDADQIKQYYEYLTGSQLTNAQANALNQQDPNGMQVKQMLDQHKQELEQQLQQVQQSANSELQKVQNAMLAQRAAEFQGEIGKVIDSALKNPDLKVLGALGDDVAEILCSDAMRLLGGQSYTLEEAKAAILTAAESRAERLNAYNKEMLKASATQQAKLSTNGIEPPGGTGIAPVPKKLKLGSKDLTAAATEWMQNQK